MLVEDLMTREVVSVRPDTPYKDIARRLLDADVGGVPVVDADGALVGIVTEADLVAKPTTAQTRMRVRDRAARWLTPAGHRRARKGAATTAAGVMTTDVVTCAPSDDARTAALRMVTHDVTRLPVVDAGRVVGVVSRHDFVRSFCRPDEEICDDVIERLRSDRNRPDDFHVVVAVQDGTVVLTGDVRYPTDAPVLVEMVRQIPGVVDVDCRMHHREPAPRVANPPWPIVTPVR
jgi:CBS domain-containing protein